jgi:hypothetical protein
MLLAFFFQIQVRADEGMWIPLYLGELNEAEMQAMGMKISTGDIYSENQSSLKDAIMLFGRGCTAELVSDQGLILTNHHCGYGRIIEHSSLENDYLTDGFWAMDKSEELSNPGLTVTFLVRMEDVTQKVLNGVLPGINETDRYEIITKNIDSIKVEAVEDTHYKAEIIPFFNGNQYFLFVNEVFEDVRLVGAPPSNIGKFGGDTDNWVWPRHTGDFSVFRIYADKENKPAKYAEDNVPYKPKKYFSISTKGVKKDDFTFVFGYPGRTQEYIPSYAVDMQVNVINPVRIKLRGKRIEIFNKAMNSSQEIRIQYAGKQSRIANGWKKYMGENRGITRIKAIEKKQAFEKGFLDWVNSSEKYKKEYGSLLDDMESVYGELGPFNYKSTYIREAVFGIEIINFARKYEKLVDLCKQKESDQKELDERVSKLRASADSYFKNYQVTVDKEVFVSMMKDYFQNNDKLDVPAIIIEQYHKHNNNFEQMADEVFENSIFASSEKLLQFLDKYKKSQYKKIEKDIAYKIALEVSGFYKTKFSPDIQKWGTTLDSLMRVYMFAQMEMQPMKKIYPDANMTLRVAYGNVDGYQPDDAVTFNYFTTLDGIMEKEDPDIYDYVVEDKLKELYEKKDYGNYGDADGHMHVCFTATNHTTGGNSGSPVLDADGNLLGLNFDRCWEGTMSDIYYDIDQCRNIALDIRYCLFIIDKFAGAGHLVEEMTLVE